MITQARFQLLVDNTIRKYSDQTLTELNIKEQYRNTMFNVVSSDKAYEEFYSLGTLGDLARFNGTLEYGDIPPGYLTRIEPGIFALGLEVERKFWDNNLSGKLKNHAEMLTTSAVRTKEKYACRAYARLNSAAFDFTTLNEEGVAVASTAHTTKADGVSTASGFSNLGTSAFSATTVEATRILANGFKNLNGERAYIDMDTLIVPDNLAEKAFQLNTTEKGYDTAAGTANFQYKRWNIIVWKQLGDYSTSNWMMVDSKLMKKYAMWINHVNDDLASTIDFETKRIKNSIYTSWGCGFLGWPWVYFHQVT